LRGAAKGLPVALEGRRHVDLVGRVSLQHLVLRDQALRAFGEEDLMAELDRRTHLAAFDQVGMGLEDGIDLLAGGDLLTIEHATPRLVDDTISQPAKVLDLSAQFLDGHVCEHVLAAHLASPFERYARIPHDLLGNADEHTVCPGLLLMALPRRHALDLVHPAPRRTRAVAKSLDSS